MRAQTHVAFVAIFVAVIQDSEPFSLSALPPFNEGQLSAYFAILETWSAANQHRTQQKEPESGRRFIQ
jgi:hypothetical protein